MRFENFNSMPLILTKYRKTATPDFSKASTSDSYDIFGNNNNNTSAV